MGKSDPRIDEYIEMSADFAKPVLNYFRKLVHEVCPEVEETVKWRFPSFVYKKKILCSLAAFKGHCSIAFWMAELMSDKALVENAKTEKAMGHLGRIQSIKDLPSKKKLIEYLKESMLLIDKNIKVPQKKKEKVELEIPAEFIAELEKNQIAKDNFFKMSPSHQREYIEWISEAKRAETRSARISKTIENLSEKKSLMWKYQKK